jgi:hypothetical protein
MSLKSLDRVVFPSQHIAYPLFSAKERAVFSLMVREPAASGAAAGSASPAGRERGFQVRAEALCAQPTPALERRRGAPRACLQAAQLPSRSTA